MTHPMTPEQIAEGRAEAIAHAVITVEHGPELYAVQARAGNWPIWRVAVAAARAALKETQHG